MPVYKDKKTGLKRKKTVYLLHGNPLMPAHRVGNPKRDECGQTPWLFLYGKWQGRMIYVEPYKMVRTSDRCISYARL